MQSRIAAEKIIPISRNYQRLAEAEALLIARVRLSRRTDLADDEYAVEALQLRVRELAWAKRWGIG